MGVQLLDQRLELGSVLGLRQRSNGRGLTGARSGRDDDVDLRAKCRLDVLLVVDAVLGQALPQLAQRLVAARELLRELVELLPLARAEVAVDRDEGESIGADELRARLGGTRGRRAATATAGQAHGKRCQEGCDQKTRRARHSRVGWRPIRLPAKSFKSSPSSTLQTPSVIGSSIPSRRERSRRTGAVVSPSTVPIWAAASSGEVPRAISSPACGCGRGGSSRCDQVAHPGEPGERLRAGAAGLAEASHLGQPAGDQRRLRVVAEPEAIDASGGKCHHVLRRGAQLDPDDVLVHVDPEGERVDGLLELERQPVVLARDHRRCGQAVGDLLGEVRPGEHRRRHGARRARIGARPSPGSSPFVRLSTGAAPGSARTTCPNAWLGTAITCRSAPASDGSSTVVAETPERSAARQVAWVVAGLLDRPSLLGVAAGQRHVVTAPGEQAAEGRPPRPGAHDRCLHALTLSRPTHRPVISDG